jgi:hypothetical protein
MWCGHRGGLVGGAGGVSVAEVGKSGGAERGVRGERKAGAARGIFAAGGGEDNRNSGGLQSRETEQRQRRKRKGVSQGLVCKTKELQGLYGKLTFPTDIEI